MPDASLFFTARFEFTQIRNTWRFLVDLHCFTTFYGFFPLFFANNGVDGLTSDFILEGAEAHRQMAWI